MKHTAAKTRDAGNADTRAAALRHSVYSDLICLLPPASVRQTEIFIANLALQRAAWRQPTTRSRSAELFRTMQRFALLKVSPDIVEAGARDLDGRNTAARSAAQIEAFLNRKYGERLRDVPGFYESAISDQRSAVRLNLPEGCALYGYRSRHGFFNGVLCQPLASDNYFFLLSAAKFGGQKAIRLEPGDQTYFSRHKDAAELRHNLVRPENQASLTGWKWNGRRFIAPK